MELRARLVGWSQAVKPIADVFDSDRSESRFDGFKSLLRRVVVVRKVTEENIAQHRGIDFSNEIGSHAVVQVTVVSHDASFEIFGIATFAQHFEVIVGFDDDVCGEAHIVVDTFADATEVGSDCKADIAVTDEIADVVGSVVHDIKRRDFKIADSEWKFLVDRSVVVLDTARDVVAAEDSVEGLGSAVDTQMTVATDETVDIADVVAVVVRQAYSADFIHRNAVAAQSVDHFCHFDSGIDQKSAFAIADIGAVARTAASETHEKYFFRHLHRRKFVDVGSREVFSSLDFTRNRFHILVGDDLEVTVGFRVEIIERIE